MPKKDQPVPGPSPAVLGWGSDIAAEMLRRLGIRYIALNPGASYRGLHDSLVNYLGNETPQMLLCLHEDHVVSIAHGYAKAADKPMAAALHSNVGLMHGSMAIFNAYCDRMPMMILGATGPVDADQRRPWIDWIHTAKDQGALVRDFVKWDDEPTSPAALVESLLRAHQVTSTEPRGPVYVCLDAGLQERKLSEQPVLPDIERYRPKAAGPAEGAHIEALADALLSARHPLILFGRGSPKVEDWDRRIELAELVDASVMTSLRERAVFPSGHGLMVTSPVFWLDARAKAAVEGADLILSLDWVDLQGTLRQVRRDVGALDAKIAHVSLDHHLHRGWSADYFGLPPLDIAVSANADATVQALCACIRTRLNGQRRWAGARRQPLTTRDYSAGSAESIEPADVEVALQKLRGDRKISLAHATYGWRGDTFEFTHPLDFLGGEAGGGLSAGPGIGIGAALALQDTDRVVVTVTGDGDFLQGATALWTAAHYQIPLLYIVSNNRSNFNDELHQEAMAKARGRPVENRWIGQRIDDPAVDLSGLARTQGVAAEGPIRTVPELEAALRRGFEAVAQGRPYLLDVHVKPGYANPPLARGQ